MLRCCDVAMLRCCDVAMLRLPLFSTKNANVTLIQSIRSPNNLERKQRKRRTEQIYNYIHTYIHTYNTIGAIMRNGKEENPYQDRRNYGRRTTNTSEETSDQQFHWLFRKKGRGKRGVTIAINSFFVSMLILNGMSSVYKQHS